MTLRLLIPVYVAVGKFEGTHLSLHQWLGLFISPRQKEESAQSRRRSAIYQFMDRNLCGPVPSCRQPVGTAMARCVDPKTDGSVIELGPVQYLHASPQAYTPSEFQSGFLRLFAHRATPAATRREAMRTGLRQPAGPRQIPQLGQWSRELHSWYRGKRSNFRAMALCAPQRTVFLYTTPIRKSLRALRASFRWIGDVPAGARGLRGR